MTGKGNINLSLFTDNIIVQLLNPMESKKIPLELTSEFSKTVEYMIDIQK